DHLRRLSPGAPEVFNELRNALRAALDLDEHPLALGNGRQRFAKSRDSFAGPPRMFPSPDIKRFQFRQRLFRNLLANTRGLAGVVVVDDDDMTVPGQLHVDLDGVSVLLPAELNRSQRVLRGVIGCSAVSDDLNGAHVL